MVKALGLLTTLFFLCRSMHAFTLNNNIAAAFRNDEVSINVASHSCDNIGVTNSELLILIEEAVTTYWNRVHTSRLRLKKGRIINVSSLFQTDLACSNSPDSNCQINEDLKVSNDILVACNVEPNNFSNNPSSVVGVTIPNNINGTNIVGALILVNDIPGNSFEGLGRNEKIAVLAHEIGHAIGLGHSQLSQNLMYFQSISTRRGLGFDDVDGITYLYPVEQPFGGCGTIGFQKNTDGSNNTFTSFLFFLVALMITLLIGRFPKFLRKEKIWE